VGPVLPAVLINPRHWSGLHFAHGRVARRWRIGV